MPPPEKLGPEEFARAFPVSRETLVRLEDFVRLLRNAPHNLVSARSLEQVWHRHIWDSAQLAPLIPANAKTLADLGSGAGFPGLVLALLLEDRLRVSLFEATAKKCRFLGEAAEILGLTVDIRNGRMEDAAAESFDVVTARACAPLAALLSYAVRFQGPRTVNLFLKGQNVEVELTEAYKMWSMQVQKHPSQTDSVATVLDIRGLGHVPPGGTFVTA